MCFKIASASFQIKNPTGVFIWIPWNHNFNCSPYHVDFSDQKHWMDFQLLNFKNVTKLKKKRI